jgi:hypothetical protein
MTAYVLTITGEVTREQAAHTGHLIDVLTGHLLGRFVSVEGPAAYYFTVDADQEATLREVLRNDWAGGQATVTWLRVSNAEGWKWPAASPGSAAAATSERTADLLLTWRDSQASLGGVVAVGSRCNCGAEAITMLDSPRWGQWDTCERCGAEQLAVLHDGDTARLQRPDLVKAQAQSSTELDRMLSA